jgi:hypothetical protein
MSLRIAATLIGLALVAYAGWIANGWRLQAERVPTLSATLRAEEMARKDAELKADVVKAEIIALRLNAMESSSREVTRERVKKVIEYVPKLVDCDLPDEPVGVLNAARSGMPDNP